MKNFSTHVILSVIFYVFTQIPSLEADGIQCYKCLVATPAYYTNETIRLCKDFDYSEKFIVNCPYSTFCMKKITSAKIPVPVNGTERDCASQKSEIQDYKNGRWQPQVTVEEPYEEGCALVNDKGLRTSSIEYCYCKGYLCNSSKKFQSSLLYLILSVIVCMSTYLLSSNHVRELLH